MTPYAHASDLLRACREAVVSCERSETVRIGYCPMCGRDLTEADE